MLFLLKGQEEYEIPSSTSDSKDKRMMPRAEAEIAAHGVEPDLDLPEIEAILAPRDYVHVALNNKFKKWKDGEDFINSLAWTMGIPEGALTDRM